MDLAHHHHLMLKILIGSAWIDQHLVPAEVNYLNRLLQRYHLEHDPELQVLLRTPIAPAQTEQWLIAYLKDSSDTERLKLLAAIGNLLISDEEVSAIEHDLLDEFHRLLAQIPAHPDPPPHITDLAPNIVQQVGKFFRHVLTAIQGGTHRNS